MSSTRLRNDIPSYAAMLNTSSVRNSEIGQALLRYIVEAPEEAEELLALMHLNGGKLPLMWWSHSKLEYLLRDPELALAGTTMRTTFTPWSQAPLNWSWWPRTVPLAVLTADWLQSRDAAVLRNGSFPARNVSLLAFPSTVCGAPVPKPEYSGNTKHVIFEASALLTTGTIVDVAVKCKPLESEFAKLIPVVDDKRKHFEVYMRYAKGVARLAHECGFGQLSPRTWVDAFSVRTRRNESSDVEEFVNYDAAFFSERFPRSATSIQRMFDNKLEKLAARMIAAIPDWQIRLLALYDVLFSYKDRHYANVLVDPWGNIYNLDATQVTLSQPSWHGGILDSIFIPTTLTFTVQRQGFPYVVQNKTTMQRMDAIAVQTLDYRCASRNGEIGFDFPPQMRTCMRRLADSTPAAIASEYELPDPAAQMLHETAGALLTKGFERTIYDLGVEQMARKRASTRRWFDACCAIVNKKCVYANLTSWDVLFGKHGAPILGHDTQP